MTAAGPMPPGSHPILETARCRLVQPRSGDAPALLEVFGDEEAMHYLQSPALRSVDDAYQMLAAWERGWQEGKGIRWIIVPKDAPEVCAGVFALHDWSRSNRRAELGAYLHHRWQGRGLALEVTREVLQFAFQKLDLHRVELRCDPRNEASMRIARNLGMTFEGILRDYVFVAGKGFVDEAVHALLRPRREARLSK